MLIHSLIIDETGGSHGIRDHQALLSLENLPKQAFGGKELYPTLFLKAAVYIRGIIMNHPFIDGNKRTGITAASVFMKNNGCRIVTEKGEIEKFALRIVNSKLILPDIAEWFKKNAKRK